MDPLPVFADEVLARLSMPVLALVGGRDVILDSAGTRRRLLSLAPRAEVEWIEGAGHAIDGQAELILRFLRR